MVIIEGEGKLHEDPISYKRKESPDKIIQKVILTKT
jgi:hypothetical protein